MVHFTSKAWVVTAEAGGLNGYGASCFFVGVFNTEKRARSAIPDYIKAFNKEWGKNSMHEGNITVTEVSPNNVNATLIMESYE